MAAYRILNERVQVLVERIVLENRGRAFASHFFTLDEVASPTPIAGNENNELDFYHWISEHLTQRGDWSEKPIIVGQVGYGCLRTPVPGCENSQSARSGSHESRLARIFYDRRIAQYGDCQDTAGIHPDSTAGIPKYRG